MICFVLTPKSQDMEDFFANFNRLSVVRMYGTRLSIFDHKWHSFKFQGEWDGKKKKKKHLRFFALKERCRIQFWRQHEYGLMDQESSICSGCGGQEWQHRVYLRVAA